MKHGELNQCKMGDVSKDAMQAWHHVAFYAMHKMWALLSDMEHNS